MGPPAEITTVVVIMAIRLKRKLATGLGCTGLLFGATASAAVEWDVTPGIYAGIVYTDNLRLQPDDQKITQLAYQLTPELSLDRVSPRMLTSVDYRAQAIIYNDKDLDDPVLHYMRFENNATLVERSLFLDISSNITQQIIDPSVSIPSSGITDNGNRSEVFTVFVAPRWEATLGNSVRSLLQYRAGLVEYKRPEQRDSTESLWDYSLTGLLGPGSSWLLRYIDSTTEYDTGEEVGLATASAELILGVGAKTALVLEGGLDDNFFTGPAGTSGIRDSYWLAGVNGSFGRFTKYDLRAGERFFGDTYSASVSRDRGNLTGEIEYTEIATTVASAQLGYQNLFEDVSDVGGIELPFARATAYVRKRLTLTYAYKLTTGRLELSVFDEDREYLDPAGGEDSDSVRGAVLVGNWSAGPRTTFDVDFTWQAFVLRNSGETPEDTRLRVRARREFGAGSSVIFTVWRTERGATVPGNVFTENAASLGLLKQF